MGMTSEVFPVCQGLCKADLGLWTVIPAKEGTLKGSQLGNPWVELMVLEALKSVIYTPCELFKSNLNQVTQKPPKAEIQEGGEVESGIVLTLKRPYLVAHRTTH